jgi:hypothetical protein
MLREFTLVLELVLGVVDLDSVDTLAAELSRKDAWSQEEVSALVLAFESSRDDGDLIRAALVTIDPALFARVVDSVKPLARAVVRTFGEFVRTHPWSFDYTDVIANAAQGLFNAVKDSEIRAELFRAVLPMGVFYNRWHVMSIAAGMLHSTQEIADVTAMTRAAKDYDGDLRAIEDRIIRSRLHPALRGLFPST